MSARRAEAVLFDFGGTLDGDGIHWSRRFDAAFRRQGLDYPMPALDEAFRSSEKVVNSDPRVKTQDLAEAIHFQVELMLRDLGFPGADLARGASDDLLAETRGYLARNSAVLRALKGRVPIGILSNFTGNLERILEEEGLRPWIGGVFDSTVVGLRKPDPAFFEHALRALGADRSTTAMIGDSVEMDLLPAHGLGLATVWVRGHEPRETSFRPDLAVGSVTELVPLLETAQ